MMQVVADPTAALLELWSPVTVAPGYEVSTWGRVRRGLHDVATWENKGGYTCVNLEVDERPRTFYLHRLVATAFRPNLRDDATQVNHENGKKPDNTALNLSWMTPADNMAHARELGLIVPRVPADVCRFGHRKRPGRHCLRCRRVADRRRKHGPPTLLQLAESGAPSAAVSAA